MTIERSVESEASGFGEDYRAIFGEMTGELVELNGLEPSTS
jgi:hypothetical protein